MSETLDQSDLLLRLTPDRLHDIGEHLSAGVFTDPDAPIIVRIAQGLHHFVQHVELEPYRGESLYPTGQAVWQRPPAMIVRWHYVSISPIDQHVLERKRTAFADTPERLETLNAIERFWRDYPPAGGYTHSIPNYDRMLAEGLRGAQMRIESGAAQAQHEPDDEARGLYDAMRITLDAARILHQRFVRQIQTATLDDPDDRANQQRLLDACARVPEHPAKTFYEAMLAANFFYYLDGPDDLGRFDQFMWPYYKADLDAGRIDRNEALALVARLWKNTDQACAWNTAIGGSKPDGSRADNDLTLVCLEAARGMRRPNLALRIRKDTPQAVWDAAFDTIRTGCGLPALYCEENYLQAIREAHLNVPDEDMHRFAFGGCTELMIHGCSNVGSLDGDFNMPKLLVDSLRQDLPECRTFDAFYEAYKRRCAGTISDTAGEISAAQRRKALWHPQPIRSLMIDDCLQRGWEYAAGGARYNWSVVNIMGLGNAVDSLCAVREVLFEKQELSAAELLDVLDRDYDGAERWRQRFALCPRYGNGHERADRLARDLSEFVFTQWQRYAPWRGGKFLPACLMFTTYALFGEVVAATPDGRRNAQPIADSAGPVQGRDRGGPTAMLRSVAGIDQRHAPGTLVVNVRFSPSIFATPQDRARLQSLVRAYFDMGGMQLQINVVDQAVLEAAMADPDKYGDMIIRIGGFSEYWKNLSPALRRSVLERTEHV
ncbi:MAG: hypothetical protein JXQ73_03535 [Phycisphaerae bacterium]|nr:hypothetical protein [Phycisphaerae bacterium]